MSGKNLALIVIAMAGLSSAIGQTTTSSTRTFNLPPIGLGSSETAEVNVANVAVNPNTGTAASCTGTIVFTNASGGTLGTATAFTLTAGQATSVRLPFANAAGIAPRTVIRAAIHLTIPTTTPRPACSLEFTLETFDSTSGATHWVITGGGEISGGRG